MPGNKTSRYNKRTSEHRQNAIKPRPMRTPIRDTLSNFLAQPIRNYAAATEIAKQYGICADADIKTLLVASCVINTMESGDVNNLKILVDLTNEKTADQKAEEDMFMRLMGMPDISDT